MSKRGRYAEGDTGPRPGDEYQTQHDKENQAMKTRLYYYLMSAMVALMLVGGVNPCGIVWGGEG